MHRREMIRNGKSHAFEIDKCLILVCDNMLQTVKDIINRTM